MPTQKEVLESHEAEQILKSDVFKKAIENLKQEYIDRWMESKGPEDGMWRENLHKSVQLLPEIERHLRIIVEKGKLTKANINKIRNIG
jgi:hypothetical protein|tara:strand:+ start:821 stop:1084 length:264 start_codon:yes stop_codon:yes gene_type:complete